MTKGQVRSNTWTKDEMDALSIAVKECDGFPLKLLRLFRQYSGDEKKRTPSAIATVIFKDPSYKHSPSAREVASKVFAREARKKRARENSAELPSTPAPSLLERLKAKAAATHDEPAVKRAVRTAPPVVGLTHTSPSEPSQGEIRRVIDYLVRTAERVEAMRALFGKAS